MLFHHICPIYFSPTGGTLRVTETIAESWNLPRNPIDLSIPENSYKEIKISPSDLCIISVPSYGGRVPQMAAQRITQLNGNGARAIVVVVYGNRAFEDTLLELKDLAESSGFCCIAAIAAVAEHSIIRQFAAGRPNEKDQKQLHDFSNTVRSALEQGVEILPLSIPGNHPYREYHVAPLIPQASSDCIHCGRCAFYCPAEAISKENPKKTDPKICISCMRCIQVCPRHARSCNCEQLGMLMKRLQNVCEKNKNNELFFQTK